MSDTQMVLSEDEKVYVARILELRFGELRVEEHRTHTPAYRDAVQQEEVLVRAILAKLGKQV